MTNEEIFERAHEEFTLRGMSIQTENGTYAHYVFSFAIMKIVP
jgi:hypothetical protein